MREVSGLVSSQLAASCYSAILPLQHCTPATSKMSADGTLGWIWLLSCLTIHSTRGPYLQMPQLGLEGQAMSKAYPCLRKHLIKGRKLGEQPVSHSIKYFLIRKFIGDFQIRLQKRFRAPYCIGATAYLTKGA